MEVHIPSRRLSIIFLLLFSLAASVLLLVFRDLPSKTSWKGWRVVSVGASLPENEIVKAFIKNGISDFASESNSLITVSPGEPVPAGYLEQVNARRKAWFNIDGTRVVYVRDRVDIAAKIASALDPIASIWSMESGTSTYIPFALVPLVLWSVAFLVSDNRRILLSALPSAVLLPISLNRWQGFLASIVFIAIAHFGAAYFPLTALAETKATLRGRIAASKALLVSSAFLIVPLLTGTLGTAVRVVAAAALGCAALALIYRAEPLLVKTLQAGRAHPFFSPVRIIPSHPRLVLKQILVPAVLAVLSFAGGMAGRSIETAPAKINQGELPCPVPAGYNNVNGFGSDAYTAFLENRVDNELPDLGDFLAVRWYIETASWRRIQAPYETPRKGTVARYTDYSIGSDGIITGTPKIMLEFDTGFIRRSLAEKSTPLERMLADQGRFVAVSLTRLNR